MTKFSKDIDEKSEWIRKGMNMSHNKPSEETIKMIDNLEKSIQVNCVKMENIEKKVDEGFKENREQHKEITDFLKEALDRKAGVWVEKVIVWAGITLFTTIVGTLAFLIKETLYK